MNPSFQPAAPGHNHPYFAGRFIRTREASLVVNLNTASEKEVESLPGIGSSHADDIIANRPYSSVDDLSRVKGMTRRVIDQLRPFAKTEGATEKRSH